MKEFDPKWCRWIQEVISRGRIGIRVNDETGHSFQTKKCLPQGAILSPILFNIVANMLAIVINRAKEDGQVSGSIPHLVDMEGSILQYAYDMITFLEHDLKQTLNTKLIVCIFEQLSCLKLIIIKVKSSLLKSQGYGRSI
jgi:hypothetical protein